MTQRNHHGERQSRVGDMIGEFQRARKRRLVNAVAPPGPSHAPVEDAPSTDERFLGTVSERTVHDVPTAHTTLCRER